MNLKFSTKLKGGSILLYIYGISWYEKNYYFIDILKQFLNIFKLVFPLVQSSIKNSNTNLVFTYIESLYKSRG